MIKQLLRKWLKVEQPKEVKLQRPVGAFSTDIAWERMMVGAQETLGAAFEKTFQKIPEYKTPVGAAMDSGSLPNVIGTKAQFVQTTGVSIAQVYWYGSQGFIGYQLCAMIAQHWLVQKACLMPAQDAVRKWFQITVNDGTEVNPDVISAMTKADVLYNLKDNLIQFVQMGRVFGIRVALFLVDSEDPLYYEKPFNIDGVKPGSYRGISQIDPYWCTPIPDEITTSDPQNKHFYEPAWWQVNSKKIHRTHLVIFRTEELPDMLKPTYMYGGVSIPQKIYERVYAAERTANEAPMLALTKRTTVMKTDLTQAQADPVKFAAKMENWVANWTNYGIKNIGIEDDITQQDTSLADLDAVIMTQYQLVAAIANVPSVKLLGTSPKGFNTTGEFEESNYHEELESIQSIKLTPLVERHHELVIRSDIVPLFKIAPFETTILWNSLDAMTAQELAELNKLKADTGAVLSASGAIDGQDERNRIIADSESEYNGLASAAPEEDIDDTDDDPFAPDVETNKEASGGGSENDRDTDEA